MLVMKKNFFSAQTHFIGVLLNEDITQTLENCRLYMNKTYGCKSGYGTPIHITLVPPFRLPDEYNSADLAKIIEHDVLSGSKDFKFNARIENFDAFGDRTIFAKVVQDEKWNDLRNSVLTALLNFAPNCTKKDKSVFTPHITVANRDIPLGVSKEALSVMNELDLNENFLLDNISIFERHGGKWIVVYSLSL